ncbi:MAG: tyrosine-protein kinase domain-containing protein [Ignavibacteria bacterium]|nr:MAG: tyrosine-protein kinase domain-containing protein [Ignavibacteria bacterium]
MSTKFPNSSRNHGSKKEKTLIEIIQIVFRRRYILIGSIVAAIILAVAYNFLSTPVYKATGLLKKEVASKRQNQGGFAGIIDLQTLDELETEIALVKTWTVISKVVDELNTNIIINKIVTPGGENIIIEQSLTKFADPSFINGFDIPFGIPEITSFVLKKKKSSGKYYIKKTSESTLEVYDALTNQLLVVSNSEPVLEITSLEGTEFENDLTINTPLDEGIFKFELPIANFEINWNSAPVGSILYFGIIKYFKAMAKLKKQLSVNKKGKTNVFGISVKSSSAYVAALIANTVIDKFRESRIDQQKQTIRYSFKFVDEQLKEMKDKLKVAEENLSRFKASGHINTINESSRNLVQFLTKLETEKVNTDLLLADYKNKVFEIKNEMSVTGYIDQSLLSPSGNTNRNSPFSTLLKQLSDLELQRLELLQRRTSNHPDVITLDNQIFMAKQKLSSYNENTLTAYQIIISSLEKKLLKISNLMSKYSVKLEMLPAKENRLAQLMRKKNVYDKISTLLLDKREEMRMQELSKLQDIAIVDPAHEPIKPISPRKLINLIIAVFLGMFIGVVGIFLFELKDNKLVNLDELEEDYNLPIFAIIPTYSKEILKNMNNSKNGRQKFVTLMNEREGFRETYRLLKTKLFFQMENKEKIFMITSCEENTGKTSIVSNLAISIAQENKKVLVIDCDLRKADLSKMFNIAKDAPGLIDFIEKDVSPTIYTKVLKNIDVLPAGGRREDSSHLLNSDRMKLLFDSIDTSFYDLIIIDTPPVTRVVDTLILGQLIRDAILIVRPGYSFKDAVIGGIQEMLHAEINIRGIVANAARIQESYYYRYRYGYGYGYDQEEETKHKSSKKELRTEKISV